jgi:hypothetical protein
MGALHRQTLTNAVLPEILVRTAGALMITNANDIVQIYIL